MMDENPFDDELKNKIVSACQVFHTEAVELSRTFLREAGRNNYVTPTSFLDMMNVFQSLLYKQRSFLYEKTVNYKSGIEKLMQ